MHRKNHSFITAIIIVSLFCCLFGGCAKQNPNTSSENTGEESEPVKTASETYHAEVHTPDDIVTANQEFVEKIRYGDGIGDFALTPLKYGEDPYTFVLRLENNNDYDAGAYVSYVFRDEAGEILSSGETKSRMLAPGAVDLVSASFGEGDISAFDSLTITAYAREGSGERVYENYDPDKIHEVDNQATGNGRRIDLSFDEDHEDYVSDYAVFYDSDGNVCNIRSFIGSDNNAWIYSECEYASYELVTWKSVHEAGSLSDQALAEYKEKGFVSKTGEEYESLDQRISYFFEDTANGHTLIHCKNQSDEVLSMRKDIVAFYGENTMPPVHNWEQYGWEMESGQEYKIWRSDEEEASAVYQLFFHPQEELYWDLGVVSGEDFYILPFTASGAWLYEPAPELRVKTDQKGAVITVEEDAAYEYNILRGSVLVLFLADGKIVGEEIRDFEKKYEDKIELDFSFDGTFDEARPYLQYRYVEIEMPGV